MSSDGLQELEAPVRRYLRHAVSEGGSGVPSVRLQMHGEIRLGRRWLPFLAREWLDPHRGFEWRASVGSGVVRVRGFDRYQGGSGEMRWRLFGFLPLVNGTGPDIGRSARGRLTAEAVWSPAALLPGHGVRWTVTDDGWLRAQWRVDDVEDELRLQVDDGGSVLRLLTTRWGNPDGAGYRALPFGGIVESERSFGSLTVPSRLSAGWWFGGGRYAEEGEFFRVELDDLVPLHSDEGLPGGASRASSDVRSSSASGDR